MMTEPTIRGTRMPKLSRTALHTALTLVSDEMLASQQRVDSDNKLRIETASVYFAVADELAAWKDYAPLVGKPEEEGGISQREYGVELSHLTKDSAEKKAKWESVDKETKKRIEYEMRDVQPALKRRWVVHEKRAKEVGIDTSSYWILGMPLPKEESTPVVEEVKAE